LLIFKIPASGTDFQNTGQAGEIPAIWLFNFILYVTPTYLDIVKHNCLHCSFQASFSSTITQRYL